MDDSPQSVTRPQKWAITAAVIGVTVWVLLIIISAVGMSGATIGPAGDPDATDGWWYSAIDCFLGVVNTAISAAACVVAVRWRGSRPQLAAKLLVPTVLPVLLLGAWPAVHFEQWTVLVTPIAFPAYLPVLLMVIAVGVLALDKPSPAPEEPKDLEVLFRRERAAGNGAKLVPHRRKHAVAGSPTGFTASE